MKILIKIAILLVIVIGGGAFYGWLQWKPIAAELSAKDQEKFDLMMAEAKSFGFGTAQKLYNELDTMTLEDVVNLRHSKWQEKLEKNEEFRNAYLEEQHKARQQESIERKSKHDLKLSTLIFKSEEGKLLSTIWKESEPWQKVMVLRQKCVKYLKMEEADSRRRTNALELSRISSILDRPEKLSCGKKMADICLAISVSDYCMELVPNADDNEAILQAMQRLKGKMNHYYYIK
ncbi:uncharacterized protein METZ01_LOCUS472605, partial [marine metagenome]